MKGKIYTESDNPYHVKVVVEPIGRTGPQGPPGEATRFFDSVQAAVNADPVVHDDEIFETPEGVWRRDNSLPEGAEFLREFGASKSELNTLDTRITNNHDSIEGMGVDREVMVNILEGYSTDTGDRSYWGVGYLDENNEIRQPESASWRYSLEYIRIPHGTYSHGVGVTGNAKLLVFDKDYNITKVISGVGNFFVDGDDYYIRTSLNIDNGQPVIENTTPITRGSDEVFVNNNRLRETILNVKSDIGVKNIPAETNLFAEYDSIDRSDLYYFGNGFLRSDGTISTGSWLHTKRYTPITSGTFFVRTYLSGNAQMVVYDSDFEVLASFGETAPNGELIEIPEGAAWMRSSVSPTYPDLIVQNKSIISFGEEKLFVPIHSYEQDQDIRERNILEKAGLDFFPAGTNVVEEINPVDLEDNDVWDEGYFRPTGEIHVSTGWYHTKKYYEITEGDYVSNIHITGTLQGHAVYDKDFNFVRVIQDVGSISGTEYEITFDENEKYIRFSRSRNYSGNVYLKNTEDYYLGGSTKIGSVSNSNNDLAVSGSGIVNFTTDIFKKSNPPKSRIPIVSFMSDDGRLANNDWYIPILEAKGVKSTFAIVTARMLDDTHDSFDSERVKELYDMGHDIAGHTHTSPDLSTLSLSEAEIEIHKCATGLAALGIDAPMFVPPFGGRTPDVDNIIRKYFKASFVTNSPLAHEVVPPLVTFNIKRFSFDAGEPGVSRLQACKDMVDYIVSNGGWCIFAIHPQYPEYTPIGDPEGYQERRDELVDLIDYIQSLEVPILTAKKAFEIYGNPVEIGNEGIDEKWYALGMDGSEKGSYFD